MVRAGVFIGVDKTGNLQKLVDAAAGAHRMHEWALSQGFSPENARLITDRNGKVDPDQIYDAIKQGIDGAASISSSSISWARGQHQQERAVAPE